MKKNPSLELGGQIEKSVHDRSGKKVSFDVARTIFELTTKHHHKNSLYIEDNWKQKTILIPMTSEEMMKLARWLLKHSKLIAAEEVLNS